MEGVVDEKKNRRIAGASTIGLHVAMLVFFFFFVGWRAPDPPLGELGYVINLGFDDQGSGDIQPEETVGAELPQVNPEVQPEQQQEPIKETPTEEVKQDDQVVAEDETAVPVKDTKKKEETAKPVEPVKEKPTEKKTEPKKEPEKPLTVYDPNAKKGTDTKVGKPGSEGDDLNKTGDKGQPDGQPGPGLYKGKAGGGGGGTGLDIDGWIWDEIPNIKAPGSESSGRVVFQIKVNSDGEIIDIKTLERSLSLEMENICRREIEKLTFSKTGTNVPAVSTGKITFVVLSN